MNEWSEKYKETIDQTRNRFKKEKNPAPTSIREFASNFIKDTRSKYGYMEITISAGVQNKLTSLLGIERDHNRNNDPQRYDAIISSMSDT